MFNTMETYNEYNYENKSIRDSSLGTPMFSKNKQILFFLIGWAGFQLIAVFLQLFEIFLWRNTGLPAEAILQTSSVSMEINSAAYFILFFILLGIANIDLKKIFRSFKQVYSYIAGIVCLISILAFNIIYNLFLTYVVKYGVSNNANQTSIVSITDLYPMLSFFVFGIIGPICEEITYRVGLFSFCKRKNRVVAYVVTMVVFSLIHFNFSFDKDTLINELVNLPYYCFAAFAFSITYDYFGFAGSVTGHIINNLISILFIKFIH